MIRPLHFIVLTPDETVLDTEPVDWVQLHLADGGSLGIYPGHAPFLAETQEGPVRYADESGERVLNVPSGLLFIEGNRVYILSEQLDDESEPESTQPEARERFDRLTRKLLDALREEPEEILEGADEG